MRHHAANQHQHAQKSRQGSQINAGYLRTKLITIKIIKIYVPIDP